MDRSGDGAEFERAIRAHDAALAARGIEVWIGNEPTFTDRHSHAPEWLNIASGEKKRQRALRALARICAQRPGAAVLRSIGRQYPGEPTARFNFGIYSRRDGARLWSGPPDPALVAVTADADLGAFQAELVLSVRRAGWVGLVVQHGEERRLACSHDPGTLPPLDDPRLRRPSIHASAIPERGLTDELAAAGVYLLALRTERDGAREHAVACVELPSIANVTLFARLLTALSEAAERAQLPALILAGFGPPVDDSVCWTTLTPDPAVVEINMTPHRNVAAFLADNRDCYGAAASVGLSPYRLYYNGAIADSGGAGQITVGGRSPESSPFFVQRKLLPRLIRYVARHPCLSYMFAHDYVGAAGQSARADELGADAFSELRLTLSLLEREAAPDPALLWRSLAPCLTDASGNSHRAELNIEKLWNPNLRGRGQLGLVEFRAFRMQHTPERAAALAALLRSVIALLMDHDVQPKLHAWGAALHDRFALPFYLEQDLCAVLADLNEHGLGLERPLTEELQRDYFRPWCTVRSERVVFSVRNAVEFWPLFGDVTSQQGSSRLVDSSTRRIELSLRAAAPEFDRMLGGFRLRAEGVELDLQRESDERGPVRLLGLRYRSFVPMPGLHPTLGAQSPIRLHLSHPEAREATEIALHEWHPAGGAYPDLPETLEEASARRAERCVVRHVPAAELGPSRIAPEEASTQHCLDLRYLFGASG